MSITSGTNKEDFSQREAWPTEHLVRLRRAIDAELAAREHDSSGSLERGLKQALESYRDSGLMQPAVPVSGSHPSPQASVWLSHRRLATSPRLPASEFAVLGAWPATGSRCVGRPALYPIGQVCLHLNKSPRRGGRWARPIAVSQPDSAAV